MKKFILMAAVGLFVSLGVNAQKMGYLNSTQLLMSLPAYEKAGKDLQAYAKTFEDAFTTMQKDYQTKVAAYQKDFNTMSDAIKDAKGSEIQALEKRMMEYQENSNKKIGEKEEQLMQPITTSIEKAINDYAKENNYDYVYKAEALLFAKDADNITKALITKMGGKMTATPAVGTTPAKPAGGTPAGR